MKLKECINKEKIKECSQKAKTGLLKAKEGVVKASKWCWNRFKTRKERRAAREEKRKTKKWWRIWYKIREWLNRLSLVFHVVWSVIICFTIEALSRHSIAKVFQYISTSPWTFLFNTYMIFATFLIVYIVRRRVFARVIISFIWLLKKRCFFDIIQLSQKKGLIEVYVN